MYPGICQSYSLISNPTPISIKMFLENFEPKRKKFKNQKRWLNFIFRAEFKKEKKSQKVKKKILTCSISAA
jgi:hypothetical protein